MDMPGKSNVAGAFVQTETKTFNKQKIALKADWYLNNTEASMTMYDAQNAMFMLTLPNTTRNVLSLNIKDNWKIDSLNTVVFTGSEEFAFIDMSSSIGKAQLSIFNNYYFLQQRHAWNLHVAWKHIFNNRFESRITIGRGERIPVNNELFGYYLFNRQDNYDYIGNSSIKNEISLNTEVSLKYTSAKFELNTSVFFNNIHRYIFGVTLPNTTPMTIGSSGVKQCQNNGNALLYGTEASFIYSPTSCIKIVHTSKYIRGKFEDGNNVPMISPYKGITSFTYALNKFSVTAENESAAPQYKYSKNFGEDFTAGYTLFNLKTEYLLPCKNTTLKLYGGIDNIFNKVYHDHLDWGNINRPGRNLFMGLKICL
jgi:iron complex outermembrane receptor protein